MPVIPFIPLIAGAAGSIGAAAISAKGAGKAADVQKAAADQQQANLAPFRQVGMSTLPSLQAGMAPGGNLIAPWTGEFKAPTVTDDPGYQFRLQQGNQAIERSAAARGGLTSGGTVKAIDQYSQGLASQEYGQAYNRALTEYGLGRENFWTNQNNAYNRLMGVSDLGARAVGAQNSALAQGAAAQASGSVGAANAWAGGLQGATNSVINNYPLLSRTWGNQSPGVVNQAPNIGPASIEAQLAAAGIVPYR